MSGGGRPDRLAHAGMHGEIFGNLIERNKRVTKMHYWNMGRRHIVDVVSPYACL
jgi:hypothetical protein